MILNTSLSRAASMGTGQVTYRLSDLEFVTAHIAIRPFLSPPYHENIFTEVRI